MDVSYYTSDSASDSDSHDEKTINLSYQQMLSDSAEETLSDLFPRPNQYHEIENILLHHNELTEVPQNLARFQNLHTLDISSNYLTSLPEALMQLPLKVLSARNNKLVNDSLPKKFRNTIKELNLSGNLFNRFPEQILEMTNLKYLYLGSNSIVTIPTQVWKLQSLNLLFLGGNQLTEVPETMGSLNNLQALILADNKIEKLPSSIARLRNLKTLMLHKNRLRTLPRDIVALRNLNELSLRDNPLVVRFVQDMTLNPPSLLELAGRAVKLASIRPSSEDLPPTLLEYLNSAHCCVNPKCKGVYFDDRVEHIKFVDFCGRFRVPLLQYLCSSRCIEDATVSDPLRDDEEPTASGYMMRKVLLG